MIIYICITKQIGINRYGLVIFQSWASPNSSILQFLVTDDAKEFWIHVFVGGFSSDEGPKPHLVSKCIGPGYLLHSHGDRWPIEIDGLPNLEMLDLSMANR